MSAFKLHTLKQKLWAIVFTSLMVRLIVFFSLPNTPTNLAPDERAYSEIARRISTGEALDQLEGLSKTSQTLVFPAGIFTRLGLDPLSATRLSALMYGIATLAFVAFLTSKVAHKHIDSASEHKKTIKLILILFVIYSFLPSHLLWSTLALRESTMEFWIVLIFGSIFLITHHGDRSNRWTYLVLILSIFLLFNTRLQVGFLLVISLSISLSLLFKVKNAPKVFAVVVMTSALSFISMSIQTDEYIVGQITSIPDRQEANQANASSAIQTLSCPFESKSEVNKVACLIWRAPYMTTTFLIRPIIGLDVTSRSSLFAAIENLLWSIGFVFALYSIVKKKRIPFIKPLLPSVVFFVLYSIAAGSYEGNLGTAFRHKSVILWVVLLLIFALVWTKPGAASEKPGNNSQESAV
jgi:hypothetical protein